MLEALSALDGISSLKLRKQMDAEHGMAKTTFYRVLEELKNKGAVVTKRNKLYAATGKNSGR